MILPIKAIPKQRPRFNIKTGSVYTPKITQEFEKIINLACKSKKPILDPCKIKIDIYFKMPISWSKKKQLDYYDKPHFKKPDLDNLIKAIMDGLNGKAYVDDSQVVIIEATKRWSNNNKIIIQIEEVI